MKRLIAAVLILVFVITFASCTEKGNTETNNSATAMTTPSVDTEPSVIPVSTDDAQSDNEQSSGTDLPTSYIGALSDEQKTDLINYVEEWYKENFSEYEVLSVEIAEDDNELAQTGYSYYPDMKPGEIIILLVHTTHGSKIKNGKIEGIPRTCFVKITDDGFEVFNEGY